MMAETKTTASDLAENGPAIIKYLEGMGHIGYAMDVSNILGKLQNQAIRIAELEVCVKPIAAQWTPGTHGHLARGQMIQMAVQAQSREPTNKAQTRKDGDDDGS